MELNDYQEKAAKTAQYPKEQALEYLTLGLNGEAGEVAEKLKKVIRDNKGLLTDEKKQEIAKEIGDVLWYCSNLSMELGFELEDTAAINLNKLFSRKMRQKIAGDGDNR